MDKQYLPIPENEIQRIMSLYELDLDFSKLKDDFKDLTRLAAKIAGTDISLVNLIDTYTQWTVSNYGLDLEQMPREDSACQYTIMEKDYFEVPDLSSDTRFKDRFYVQSPLDLRYYFGVPLQTTTGINIGALCVLDKAPHTLDNEKIELLKIIADEIVNRLKSYKAIDCLQHELDICKETKKKAAHDIRGPLSGIIGLSTLLEEEEKLGKISDESREYIQMILESSRSLIKFSEELLTTEGKNLNETRFSLNVFKEELIKLYQPQAISKSIDLEVIVLKGVQDGLFPKNKLIQIAGNLISNAIKFTSAGGAVDVVLQLQAILNKTTLKITVSDNGIGFDEEQMTNTLSGAGKTTPGTQSETGYGYGLNIVKQLIHELKAHLQIHSEQGKGTTFDVIVPEAQ